MGKIQTIKSKVAREKFSDIITKAQYEDNFYVIERFNQPMAVIIGYNNWKTNQVPDSQRKKEINRIISFFKKMGEKSRGWDGVKEIRKWRDANFES